jgi:hypothetical protein
MISAKTNPMRMGLVGPLLDASARCKLAFRRLVRHALDAGVLLAVPKEQHHRDDDHNDDDDYQAHGVADWVPFACEGQ